MIYVTDRAFLNYEKIGENAVNLWHTEVPSVFRGKGVAKVLAQVSLILTIFAYQNL